MKTIKNFIWAICDQLTRQGALRNIFITRKAFGIFSRDSHAARTGNKPKTGYPSKAAALKAAAEMGQRHGMPFSAYKCAWCDGWHIGKHLQHKPTPDAGPTASGQALMHQPNALYERLKALPIVDLAPVYTNGVRGRTMSSPANNRLLPQVCAAGVTTVIDLRTADHTDRFEHKVKAAGMAYHHFAIDSKTTDARNIIASLPRLFALLDSGNFYIACAMGLHRTDIALAAYYVFHPSVPFDNVPELRGHRKDGRLRKDDIACRLNSIMRALTPADLQALGIPADYETTFNRRKKRLFAVNAQF